MSRPVIQSPPFPSEIYAADLIPSGCEVVEDVEQTVTHVSQVSPCKKIFRGAMELIDADEMRRRAAEQGCDLGLVDGKVMMADLPALLEKFGDGLIQLSGTVMRDSEGTLCIPCLELDTDGDGSVSIYLRSLDDRWYAPTETFVSCE